MTRFGHIVLGPPGSGKTTYCEAMREHLSKKGRRVSLVNLDPANDFVPADVAVDIRELVTIEEVMEAKGLGPNGALMFAMDFLASELDWLRGRVEGVAETAFLLVDLPGQVELFNNSHSLPAIIRFLEKDMDLRLTAVHLVDSYYCADPAKFISVLLSSLSTMLHLELPHINVLSKMDLMKSRGELPLPLESFLEVMDLNYLIDCFPDDPFLERHKQLSRNIVSVVEDYSLVHFLPLDINARWDESVTNRVGMGTRGKRSDGGKGGGKEVEREFSLEEVVKVEPARAEFESPEATQVLKDSTHDIENKSHHVLAIKMKCTDLDHFSIIPATAILKPGVPVNLTLSRRPHFGKKDQRVDIYYARCRAHCKETPLTDADRDPSPTGRAPGNLRHPPPPLRLDESEQLLRQPLGLNALKCLFFPPFNQQVQLSFSVLNSSRTRRVAVKVRIGDHGEQFDIRPSYAYMFLCPGGQEEMVVRRLPVGAPKVHRCTLALFSLAVSVKDRAEMSEARVELEVRSESYLNCQDRHVTFYKPHSLKSLSALTVKNISPIWTFAKIYTDEKEQYRAYPARAVIAPNSQLTIYFAPTKMPMAESVSCPTAVWGRRWRRGRRSGWGRR